MAMFVCLSVWQLASLACFGWLFWCVANNYRAICFWFSPMWMYLYHDHDAPRPTAFANAHNNNDNNNNHYDLVAAAVDIVSLLANFAHIIAVPCPSCRL